MNAGQATDPHGTPSDAEVVELTRQVAVMARDGLPLPSGLRALGREMPAGSLRRMVDAIAARVESGESLDEALRAEGSRFPSALRGLIAAGARSGRLAEAMGRFLDLHDLGSSLGRQLKVGLVYPLLLLILAFGVFVGVAVLTTSGFATMFADFGMNLPWITVVLIEASRAVVASGWWLTVAPVIGLAVLWAAMRLTLGPAERQAMLQSMPMLGPLSRETALAQFCPVLALLIETDVPLVEALEMSASASRDVAMASAARGSAAAVAEGESLGRAVSGRKPFPPHFGAFLTWAQDNGVLVEALRMSAETFEARARARAAFLARFCNAVSTVLVLWWVGLTVIALFLPMIQLLGLLGGNGMTSADPAWVETATFFGIGVLACLGVGAVLVLAWPVLWRGLGIAAGGLPESMRPGTGRPFWFLAAAGWSIVGVTCVFLAVGQLANWTVDESLPPWWRGEIWPVAQFVCTKLLVIGLLLVVLAAVSERVRARKMGQAVAKDPGPRRQKLRLPAWRFGLRHMMFAMAPLALLFVVARDLRWSLPTLIALLLPPLMIVSAYVVLTSRQVLQRETLLRVMAMAARVGQPLGPAVEAFAATCLGRYRRRAAEFAAHLDSGDPLPLALDRAPAVLSRSGEVVARVGYETGTLSRMLDDAVDATAHERASRVVAGASITYPLAVLGTMALLAFFMMTRVAPAFASIFNDFDVPMPEPTKSIFQWLGIARPAPDSSRVPAGGDPFTALLLGTALLPIGIGLFLAARRLFDAMPIRDRLLRRRHAAILLRALAAGVETGQAIPSVLARMAESYPRPWVRRRLRKAIARIDRGEDWCSALKDEDLILPADSALLRAAGRAGNLAWAMRETAESGERRLSYHLQAIGQVLQPIVVVGMGGFVLVFALVYFRPLIALIDSLTETLP